MTKTQFRHDLRRGLGSCPLELERCTDVEDYREDLLWGLEHALAYDAQCEGTRSLTTGRTFTLSSPPARNAISRIGAGAFSTLRSCWP